MKFGSSIEDDRFKVFFSNSSEKSDAPERSIIISPSQDTWNDFGYLTKVKIRISTEHGVPHFDCVGKFGIVTSEEDEKNDNGYIKNLVKGSADLLIAVDESTHFFTMLYDMDSYRKLVAHLGEQLTKSALISMNEIVAIQEFSPSTIWLEHVLELEIFHKAFIRTSESYYAFKNAGAILRGVELDSLNEASSAISIDIQLKNNNNPERITFQFDQKSELPKRIAVIIGENGVGKSQTLGAIVNAALKDDEGLMDTSTNGRVLFSRLLAFAPTNEIGSVFPADKSIHRKVWYRKFCLNRSKASKRGLGTADLILQLARSEEYIGNRSRYKIFTNAIKSLREWQHIALPVKDSSARSPVPLNQLKIGSEKVLLEKFSNLNLKKDPVRLDENDNEFPLSSGEISFLRFAAQSCLYIESGSILLLDEPETHLHPRFISQFVSLLNNILGATGSIAIIATHSVYVVKEVFQAQVTILRADADGNLIQQKPNLSTFGADVGAISYFVFGEDEPTRLASDVEDNLISKYESWNDLFEEYKNELSLEILGSLREKMEAKL